MRRSGRGHKVCECTAQAMQASSLCLDAEVCWLQTAVCVADVVADRNPALLLRDTVDP